MKVGIVSPSSSSTFCGERRRQLYKGLKTIKSLGLGCILSEHAEAGEGYVSDTLEHRLEDFHKMYSDKDVNAIIASNGGWNSNQLLPYIDYRLIKKHPKPLMGFSDISILMNAIYRKTGIEQIHGPLVTWGFHKNDKISNESFLNVLNHKSQKFALDEFGKWLKGDKMKGILIGGNIVSMSTLLGTKYEPKWSKKIFFWEETEETIYHLDRVLVHFKNAGVWNKISGMIIGNIDNAKEEFGKKKFPVDNLITDHFSDYKFPILKTKLFGHNIKTHISIPIGGMIDADNKEIIISPKIKTKKLLFF